MRRFLFDQRSTINDLLSCHLSSVNIMDLSAPYRGTEGLVPQFHQQNSNTVHQRDNKDAGGRFIAPRINIQGKKQHVGQQAQATQRGNKPVLVNKKLQKLTKRYRWKFDVVQNNKAQQRGYQSDNNAHGHAILRQKKCSSLFQVALLIYNGSGQTVRALN